MHQVLCWETNGAMSWLSNRRFRIIGDLDDSWLWEQDRFPFSAECLNHEGLEPVSLSTGDRRSYFYANRSKLEWFYISIIFRDAKAWQCGTEGQALTLEDGSHPRSSPTVGIMSIPTAPQGFLICEHRSASTHSPSWSRGHLSTVVDAVAICGHRHNFPWRKKSPLWSPIVTDLKHQFSLVTHGSIVIPSPPVPFCVHSEPSRGLPFVLPNAELTCGSQASSVWLPKSS